MLFRKPSPTSRRGHAPKCPGWWSTRDWLPTRDGSKPCYACYSRDINVSHDDSTTREQLRRSTRPVGGDGDDRASSRIACGRASDRAGIGRIDDRRRFDGPVEHTVFRLRRADRSGFGNRTTRVRRRAVWLSGLARNARPYPRSGSERERVGNGIGVRRAPDCRFLRNSTGRDGTIVE